MLQTFYDSKIKSINSINTFNNFNFMASRMNKEIMFKIYQNKIKFIPYKVMINTLYSEREFIENYKILYKNKLSSTNLNNFMFKVKPTFPSENKSMITIILLLYIMYYFLIYHNTSKYKLIRPSHVS